MNGLGAESIGVRQYRYGAPVGLGSGSVNPIGIFRFGNPLAFSRRAVSFPKTTGQQSLPTDRGADGSHPIPFPEAAR